MPPQTSTQLPTAIVTPEDFEHIPDTGSYVATSKITGSKEKIISGIKGYDMFRIAQELGLYLTSTEEWGKSREYFQNHPRNEFHGRTGKDIENGYISGHIEQTGSLLAFVEKDQYPRDVHDLLKAERFDGKIALIDFPWAEKDGDEDIFVRSPRTRIRDVTEINHNPFPRGDGFVHGYDPDTGLITKTGLNEMLGFYSAYYLVTPEGTRVVHRGCWHWAPLGGRRFYVDALWGPSDSRGGVSARLSSGNEPSEILKPRDEKTAALRERILQKLDETQKTYDTLGERIGNLEKLAQNL